MIYRYNYPNEHKWNGIGGKLEPGENALLSIIREVKEEADLDITKSDIHYAGIVTWDAHGDQDGKAMYAYVVDFGKRHVISADREIREGILAWKDISWVTDKANDAVVANIPYFLPIMLEKSHPQRFHCEWSKEGKLEHFTTEPL